MTPIAPDFESRYQDDPDPFGVRHSPYERRKLAIVLASLAGRRYRRAWDAACGTGDLALALTDLADEVLATDASPTAAQIAGELLGDRARTAVNALPHHPGVDDVDLVVLSEVCYYLDEPDRLATYALVDALAAPDAEVVGVTWRHEPGDAHLSGAAATAEMTEWFTGHGWRRAVLHDDTDFLAVHLVRGRAATPTPGAPA